MVQSLWERKIHRAEEVIALYPSSSELLSFLLQILRFQQGMFLALDGASLSKESLSFDNSVVRQLARHLPGFLSVVESHGPRRLADAAQHLRAESNGSIPQLIDRFWKNDETEDSDAETDFLARGFLQPYAVLVRSRTGLKKLVHTPCVCPFCDRKPVAGVLRPVGDGGQRSLVCSLCLAEWEFRRILCPACGEADPAKLPIYNAEELSYVRVECCDTCRKYLKTIDLTRNGLADPVVDEVASVPLDLWAQKQGYFKLQANLLQL